MKKTKRTYTKAILLRVSDEDFIFLKACSWERSLNMQEYLRDLIRYGRLPVRETYDINEKRA